MAKRVKVLVAALAFVVLVPRAASGDGKKKKRDEDAPIAAPTSTKLERRELERRPRNRPINLLQHLPGLAVLGQGGVAPQYFVRGFDAGYGSALGVEVDGVPLNQGSHAYSHGYSDVGFLIPETVDSLALYEVPTPLASTRSPRPVTSTCARSTRWPSRSSG